MKVTSKKSISFPSLNWGINKGKTRELPKDKKAQEIILAHPAINEAGKSESKVEDKEINKKIINNK